MKHDDEQRGYVLTRRQALGVLGATGALVLARKASALLPADSHGGAPASPGACVVRPQQTEGPYFVDEMLNRSDIRSDPSDSSIRPGALLALTFSLSNLVGGVCKPLAGVYFDLWHCDHRGVYSDVQDPDFDTRGKKYLRGYQVSDVHGNVAFTTIYPGWYPGRTVHMHFKIRSAPDVTPGFEFTSQLYFDDGVTDAVLAEAPYAAEGQRTVRNSGDGIYRRGGAQLLLSPKAGAEGWEAAFDIALQNVVSVEPQSWTGVKEGFRA